MLLLQIFSATLLFLNKVYVRKQKPIGWLYGICGVLVMNAYLYLQMLSNHKYNLYIIIVFDFALAIIMAYGYIIAISKNDIILQERLKKWNILVKAIITTVTIGICLFLFNKAMSDQLAVVQLSFTITCLFGTLLLAFEKRRTNIIGWAFYIVAHSIATYMMFKTDSSIIAVFQIFSAGIAIDGLRNELRKK